MSAPVFIVSGLPRSGTSMLMQMLQAGGLELFTDGARAADEDNPLGYCEHQAIKSLARDASCLREAAGKAVKVVAPLLTHVPADLSCRVLFIERELDEVLQSQRKMIERAGAQGAALPPERLKTVFSQQVAQAKSTLASRAATQTLYLQHSEVLQDAAAAAARINAFLSMSLDQAAMAAVVDRSLHRNIVAGS